MLAATTRGFLNATDLADYLVTRGMPFREAHSCVGNAVAFCLERGKELHELDLSELKTFSALISDDIFGLLTPQQMVDRRQSAGGTASVHVAQAVAAAAARLAQEAEGRDGPES